MPGILLPLVIPHRTRRRPADPVGWQTRIVAFHGGFLPCRRAAFPLQDRRPQPDDSLHEEHRDRGRLPCRWWRMAVRRLVGGRSQRLTFRKVTLSTPGAPPALGVSMSSPADEPATSTSTTFNPGFASSLRAPSSPVRRIASANNVARQQRRIARRPSTTGTIASTSAIAKKKRPQASRTEPHRRAACRRAG